MTGNDLVFWLCVQLLRLLIGAVFLGAVICSVVVYYAK